VDSATLNAALGTVEPLDSDGDTFTNIAEITAQFFPGDANDHPAVAGPTIQTPSPLAAGTVGTAYSQQLAATGGTTPYTWTVAAGSSLPAGLNLSTSGLLSGTPTAAGTFNFSITVSGGGTDTNPFVLTINAAGAQDNVAPTVVSTVPDNNSTGLQVTAVSATFSEAILPSSVTTSSFTLRSATDNVTGTVSVNGAVATFTPTAALADNTTYTATLTTAITDIAPAANHLAANYAWSFTTGVTAAPSSGGGGNGGCAIAGTGGGAKELAGAFGALVLAAIGLGLRRRRREE
jgi:hypothetical protein